MPAHLRLRRGFTLVEMLVVITIIGTLMAMLLPAIQSARETARSINCRANLTQLHTATDLYEGALGQYPGYQNAIGNVGQYQTMSNFVSKTPGRKASWTVALLPYLEQAPIFDQWSSLPLGHAVPVAYLEFLNCPSDDPQAVANFPALSYVANAGFGWTVDLNGQPQDPPGAESIYDGPFMDRFDDEHNPFDNRKPNINKSTVSSGDGTSHTLLFSENIHATRQATNDSFNTWVAVEAPHDDPTLVHLKGMNLQTDVSAKRYTVFVWFDQSTPVTVINGQKYTAEVRNDTHEAARPSSFHPGGVNVVFAGGNATFLRETIDYRIYQQLCTTNDKKSELKNIYPPANFPPPLSDASFQ